MKSIIYTLIGREVDLRHPRWGFFDSVFESDEQYSQKGKPNTLCVEAVGIDPDQTTKHDQPSFSLQFQPHTLPSRVSFLHWPSQSTTTQHIIVLCIIHRHIPYH